MATLDSNLRRALDRAVVKARGIAEDGARKALEGLAVGRKDAWPNMTPDQRTLRNRLRAHGKQLGDRRDEEKKTQAVDRLVGECAYEYWHRMLFARFLTENDLLIEPASGMSISLDDCKELAAGRGVDWLQLASELAVGMLPQIFRAGDPVLEVALPPETRKPLEEMLESLPREVFLADDGLGWVYQFWQSEEKKRVNESGTKIGAGELPAVTQLFTEDYMVLFLLHNTLGAWWAGKRLAEDPELAQRAGSEDDLRAACAPPGVEWTYLRFVRDEDGPWRPAAGTFDGWPKDAKNVTVLDPCMGSGHFLVFALPILVAFRMAEEGLIREEAVDAVLRDNIFGLEIDPRCTQIAAFNLALAAWRMVGYRPLPPMNLACSGLTLGVTKAEWLKLAERAVAAGPLPPERDLFGSTENLFSAKIKDGFEALYDLFGKAPWLGSLIDPRAMKQDLLTADFGQLEPAFTQILEAAGDDEVFEAAVAARGMAKAAGLLGREFTLVLTNVPYLGRVKQDAVLRDHCGRIYPEARADLATCFVKRCVSYCFPGGSTALVTPQNWLFLTSYGELRKRLFNSTSWSFTARLGAGGFETITGEVVKASLTILSRVAMHEGTAFAIADVSSGDKPQDKASALLNRRIQLVLQSDQLDNPDSAVTVTPVRRGALLKSHARSIEGLSTGDKDRFLKCFWETSASPEIWEPFQSSPPPIGSLPYDGCEYFLRWELGVGEMCRSESARVRGHTAWGKAGVLVGQMASLSVSLAFGIKHDKMTAVIVPNNLADLSAIWAFCTSNEYRCEVRNLTQKLNAATGALVKVPFELLSWQHVATEMYPQGLPKPYSNAPTQWLFSGHPCTALKPLQVAVARLLGYRWPRQMGFSFPDCPALEPDGLEHHADADGIVCLTPLRGEASAADRLRGLLADAFGDEWSAAKQSALLAAVGYGGKSLEDWLRDGFFEQHCVLFHQRPFVWHVWDGLKNGFSALVNYHKLAGPDGEGRRTLEKLIYAYLGDWIERQRADQKNGQEGADLRLAAAEHLQKELIKIRDGEPPYDIFVRWKPIAEQAIGWEPDVNDGVRLNIRPFMTAKPFKPTRKDACILRVTPRIKWDKDRGKEPNREKQDFPWFWGWDGETADFAGGKEPDGNRWNDLHYSTAFKRATRERKKAGTS